jgi:hypothetical protein
MNARHLHQLKGTGLQVLECDCDIASADEPYYLPNPLVQFFKMWFPVEFAAGFISGLLLAAVMYGVTR